MMSRPLAGMRLLVRACNSVPRQEHDHHQEPYSRQRRVFEPLEIGIAYLPSILRVRDAITISWHVFPDSHR